MPYLQQGIWRGSAEIKAGKNPRKTHQKIDKALGTMSEKWRKMHSKDG